MKRFFILILCLMLFQSTITAAKDTVMAFYESAVSYFDKKDYASAIIQLQNVLNRESANLPARILLGKARLKSGNAIDAEKELLLAEEMGADTRLTSVPLADAFVQQGKHQALLDYFDVDKLDALFAAEIHARFGMSYLGQNEINEAEKHYAKALLLKPDFPLALAGMARILTEQKKFVAANKLVNKALQLDSRSVEAWLVKGIIATKRDQQKLAKHYYSEVLKINPEHNKAANLLNLTLMSLGEYKAAIKNLEAAALRSYWDPRIFYLLGIAKFESGDEEGATEAMKKAAETLELAEVSTQLMNKSEVLLLSAVISSINEQDEKAVRLFEQYFLKKQGNKSALKLYGSSLINVDQSRKAILHLKKALALDPNDIKTSFLLANAYQKIGERQPAIEIYQKILKRYPYSTSVSLRYAGLMMANRKRQAAIKQLSKAQSKSPENGAINRALALAYLEVGEEKKGLKLIEKLLKKNPDNVDLENIRANAFFRMGQYKKAKDAFLNILKQDPSFIQAHLNLAKVETAMGHLTKAKDVYWAILDAYPKHTRTMYELAKIEMQQGNLSNAKILLEKAWNENSHLILVGQALVELYLKLKQNDKALDLALDMKDYFKKNLLALITLSKTYFAIGNRDIAVSLLNRISVLAKNDHYYLTQVSQEYLKLGKIKQARILLTKLLAEDSNNLLATQLLTRLDIKQNRLNEALARITALLKTHTNIQLFELKGDAEFALKKYQDAINTYQYIYKKRATERHVIKLYRVLRLAKKNNKAFQVLKNFMKTHQKARLAGHLFTEALLLQQRERAAILQYQTMLLYYPKDVLALNNLASILLKNKNPEALEIAEQAYDIAPKSASILDTYGWANFLLGDKSKALRLLREAVVRDNRSPSIHYHLAVILKKNGQMTQAKKHLNFALNTKKSFDEAKAAQLLLKQLSH